MREKHNIFLRVKWIFVRLFFLMFAFLSLIFPPFAILLSPYFCWFFFRNFNVWRYRKHVIPIYLWGWVFLLKHLRKNEQLCLSDMTSPPTSVPLNKSLVVRKSWPFGTNSCGKCSRCCVFEKCVFHTKSGRCLSHKSPFWDYFNCGRYPANAREIKRYKCNKWILKGRYKHEE